MTKTFDPLDGVTDKTNKEDLRERLRKAGAHIRRTDRAQASQLQAVEERLRAKYVGHQPETLKQVIVSATETEWEDAIEFLEEFEDMLPTSLQRLVLGGRVLLGTHEAAG